MFRIWIKTLLHCGCGKSQTDQMTYEPMHSAQEQCKSEGKNIFFWIWWSPL